MPLNTAQAKIVQIQVGDEIFETSGLTIEKQGYLEVYTYESWSDQFLPNFRKGDKIKPIIALE